MADHASLMRPFRDRIDALDARIVDLLAERMGVIREVGAFKAAHNIPAVLPDRVEAVRERAALLARARGLDPDLLRDLYDRLIRASCAVEDDIIAKHAVA